MFGVFGVFGEGVVEEPFVDVVEEPVVEAVEEPGVEAVVAGGVVLWLAVLELPPQPATTSAHAREAASNEDRRRIIWRFPLDRERAPA